MALTVLQGSPKLTGPLILSWSAAVLTLVNRHSAVEIAKCDIAEAPRGRASV